VQRAVRMVRGATTKGRADQSVMFMPMGSGSRLDAVLRAGEKSRLSGASYSGAPGDSAISYARNAPTAADGDGKAGLRAAASKVKAGNRAKKLAAPSIQKRTSGQSVVAEQDDDGDFGGNDEDQGFGALSRVSSSDKVGKFEAIQSNMRWLEQEWKRMKKQMEDEYAENTKKLVEARQKEEQYVEEHHKLSKMRDDEYKKRVDLAIKEIEEQLKQKNQLLDKCQEGEEGNNTRVKELELRIKSMTEDQVAEIKRLKEDAAQKAADEALEATRILDAKVEELKQCREEIQRLTQVATKDNDANEKVREELQACRRHVNEQQEAFKKAQEEACNALAAALKAMNAAAGKQGLLYNNDDEKFRKDMKDFVTSASAEEAM